jgi:uncharacterized membrane protein
MIQAMLAAAEQVKEVTAQDIGHILLWCLVLLVLVVAGFLVSSWARSRLRSKDEPQGTGFSLEELRRLHRNGQLSSEEYERARARLVAGLTQDQRPKKP